MPPPANPPKHRKRGTWSGLPAALLTHAEDLQRDLVDGVRLSPEEKATWRRLVASGYVAKACNDYQGRVARRHPDFELSDSTWLSLFDVVVQRASAPPLQTEATRHQLAKDISEAATALSEVVSRVSELLDEAEGYGVDLPMEAIDIGELLTTAARANCPRFAPRVEQHPDWQGFERLRVQFQDAQYLPTPAQLLRTFAASLNEATAAPQGYRPRAGNNLGPACSIALAVLEDCEHMVRSGIFPELPGKEFIGTLVLAAINDEDVDMQEIASLTRQIDRKAK